jgi:hypothetical protein
VEAGEGGFGIEEFEVTGGTGHEEKDDPFGARGVVG